MTKEHTPTPWKQDGVDILDIGGTQIATTALAGFHADVSDEENAAHIVKCVNMHDELVEALQKAHMAIAASLLIACGIYPTQHNIDQTIAESEKGTITGDIQETLKKAGAV